MQKGYTRVHMFGTEEEQRQFIYEHFPEVTDSRKDDDHWDLECTKCKVVRGFKVVRYDYNSKTGMYSTDVEFKLPMAVHFECPVCHQYKTWLVFQFVDSVKGANGHTVGKLRLFRMMSIPDEGLEDMESLPTEPASLRKAYREGVRAMGAGANIAAATMFRRALQVITRDIIKVSPAWGLGTELKSAVGMSYNGVTIKKDFADNGYIIKEAGDQAAHPDPNPDLLDFTAQDAEDLRKLFVEIALELFILPDVIKKAREDVLNRRKITLPKPEVVSQSQQPAR